MIQKALYTHHPNSVNGVYRVSLCLLYILLSELVAACFFGIAVATWVKRKIRVKNGDICRDRSDSYACVVLRAVFARLFRHVARSDKRGVAVGMGERAESGQEGRPDRDLGTSWSGSAARPHRRLSESFSRCRSGIQRRVGFEG